MADKTNKLTVGLVRAELVDVADIIKDGAAALPVDGLGTFYTQPSFPRAPSWIQDFFGSRLGAGPQLITSSAKGLLLVPLTAGEETRIFAVLFGHGRHLLKDGALEDRFGLKVVLNSVDPDSLRSIDKTALGSVPKQSREQISREGGASSFGIDVEQDLVNAVTGKSRIERFGRTISGRDTFAASAKFDAGDVKDFLADVLSQYRSLTYQDRFDWIDQIKDVRPSHQIAKLNDELIARLQRGELDHIWMAPPEIVDWADVKGFRYCRKRSDLHTDLDPAQLLVSLGEDGIDFERLKSADILLVSATSDTTLTSWSAYRCIYAEIVQDGTLFILNAGKWFAIAKDFTELVNNDFVSMPESDIVLPDYAHGNEALYNKAATSALAGSHCLDADVIVHGGGQSRIEFCDLLTADKRLVHVKRYSGSAQLSHLFAQGVVSAELFVTDAEFRRKLNEKLPDHHKLNNCEDRPNPEEFEVVYAIITDSANALNIPFFSKVTLRNAGRRLRGYGYRVSKKKVTSNKAKAS
ncbi:TIGR04141 family sporadically distributed protein [Croceibacterium sp. TMG7-5b_MA50]|uniref:TIGR04141 family sporadically distributed protein n=1 Tax=Croceibacterium sp. TMG7-5b_MA50 TaxID=3121290 RepID=UPI003221D34B